MPFISPDRVKIIRDQIKKEYPTFKFSITCRHYSEVAIYIMEGNIDFTNKDGNNYVNEYYINENFVNNELARNMLNRIKEIANSKNGIETEDADYGTVPNYYVHIGVGKWDKPYVLRSNDNVKVA